MTGKVCRVLASIIFLVVASACLGPAKPAVVSGPAVAVETAVFNNPAPCDGRFTPHTLAHTTTVPGGDEVRAFEANGGGVAAGDLDGDGDLDLVLANHAVANTILWNDGALTFRAEPLGEGDARTVHIVDVDGDGHLDIFFTRRVTPPNLWRNEGDGRFTATLLPGIDKPLYAANWADVDGDGDLDLAGATYDAALLTELGFEFLNSGQAGVYVYEQADGRFSGVRLAENAQALALALLDLNGDHRPDIFVGNDFGVPDYVWLRTADGWAEAAPFTATTHSTMSIDAGDIDNDGTAELFATDMHPYSDDAVTLEAWAPIMESMMDDPHLPGDPQIMENVLQRPSAAGFANAAVSLGVSATGWSWSGKFGDLDRDGFLDLYVVNGFAEATTLAHLPGRELVEENQAFRNSGGERFEPMPDWGLNATAGGRGMVMADLDDDGDLDIVVNNLNAPAQLFENGLCGGAALEVALLWPGSGNSHAIGARLTVETDASTYYRDVRVGSGYLSGDPARLHIGFPADGRPQSLTVRWPDGAVTVLKDVPNSGVLTITREK